ncbi:MAG TPA: hypothetical protein PKH77_05970 [Anaerolineae bacterium]|nr:hypothetical protein [Anaerolineae bacterium]
MPTKNTHHLHAWKLFAGGLAVVLALLIGPLWLQSVTLAAPQAQGTLPPRYTPTPEATAVTPTTPPPTTPPTTPQATEAPGPQTPATILLPDTGSALTAPGFVIAGLSLTILGVTRLASHKNRREQRKETQ